ncbi:MAG: BglG family transcription antiterminator [Erysipelotrichaceae bacterium]
MITDRQLSILKFLLDHKKSLTMNDLLEYTNMSERTIRYDISNLRNLLNDDEIELRYAPQIGFFIPINQIVSAEQLYYKLKNNRINSTVETKEEIYHEILMMLAVYHYVSLEKFTKTLYLSERVVFEYLANFENFYQSFFKLKNKRGYGYYIEGDEYQLRVKIAEMIVPFISKYNDPNSYYSNLPVPLKPMISINRLNIISTNYKKLNAKYQLWLDNGKFINVFSYLIIRYIRLEHFLSLNMSIKSFEITKGMSGYCHELLDDKLDVDSHYELICIANFLEDNNIFINDIVTDEPQIDSLLKEIIKELKTENYEVNFDNLYDDLFLHFQALLNKNHHNRTIEETLILKDIKNKYQREYDLAKKLVKVFTSHFDYSMSEEETGYIAIYLSKNKIDNAQKKRVVVVCSTGRGLSNLLVTRIKHVFPQLEIVEQLSYYQVEKNNYDKKIDFVITTMPMADINYPVVTISNILSTNDIKKISSYLSEDISEKLIKKYTLSEPFKNLSLSRDDELINYSKLVSEITLSLIELTTEIQSSYPMDYGAILGLTIHMLMAIPRWFNEESKADEVVDKLYGVMELEHPELVKKLNLFFSEVEQVLMISISIYERFAFYQYILRRKSDEKITY